MFPIWLLWGEGTVREQRWSVESSWPIGHDPGRVGSSLDRGVTGEVERCAVLEGFLRSKYRDAALWEKR